MGEGRGRTTQEVEVEEAKDRSDGRRVGIRQSANPKDKEAQDEWHTKAGTRRIVVAGRTGRNSMANAHGSRRDSARVQGGGEGDEKVSEVLGVGGRRID